VDFLIAKATDGLRGLDKQWLNTLALMLALGADAPAFTAYGVLEANEDPVAQGIHFATTVKDAPLVFAPALDFELAHNETGVAALHAARMWVETVEQALGRSAMVYTSPSFVETLEKYAGDAADEDLGVLGDHALWVAHYGVLIPRVPPPWVDYAIHQRGPKGATLPGTKTPVDVDVFRGAPADLLAL
jgi:lysozyme